MLELRVLYNRVYRQRCLTPGWPKIRQFLSYQQNRRRQSTVRAWELLSVSGQSTVSLGSYCQSLGVLGNLLSVSGQSTVSYIIHCLDNLLSGSLAIHCQSGQELLSVCQFLGKVSGQSADPHQKPVTFLPRTNRIRHELTNPPQVSQGRSLRSLTANHVQSVPIVCCGQCKTVQF